VHTDNAGDGDLNVFIEGPGGVEEPVRVNKVLRQRSFCGESARCEMNVRSVVAAYKTLF